MINEYLTESGDIAEYVVRGGTMSCTLGSAPDRLNMPYSHGVFLKDKPQLNVTDSKGGSNIICFGTCSRSVPPPVCTPTIATNWVNMSDTKLRIEEKEALIDNALVFCIYGGTIRITDNGQ